MEVDRRIGDDAMTPPPSPDPSGSSCIPGLEARIAAELTELAPASMRPAVVAPPEYMPENTLKTSVWTGGAILAKVRPQAPYTVRWGRQEVDYNTAFSARDVMALSSRATGNFAARMR